MGLRVKARVNPIRALPGKAARLLDWRRRRNQVRRAPIAHKACRPCVGEPVHLRSDHPATRHRSDLSGEGTLLRQRQRVLTEAASAVLASVLPGQQQARRSDMDALLGADSEALTGLPPSTRIACMAGVVWARLHSGQHSSALAFIEKRVLAGLRNVAAEMTPSTQSTCYSIIAEFYLLNGYLAEGLHCAEQAFDYAIEARDIGCEFRALSLRSLGFSLNGEIAQAEPLAEAASALSAERGWVAGSSFCSLSRHAQLPKPPAQCR